MPNCMLVSQNALFVANHNYLNMHGNHFRPSNVEQEKDNSLNHSCVSPEMGCLEYYYTLDRLPVLRT